MGDAGQAWRLIDRTNPVPDHMRDDRRAVIGYHHDLHAIVERKSFGVEDLFLCRGKSGEKGQARQKERQPAHDPEMF